MPAIRPMPFSRRWRPRSLILVVSALALATAALVVAAVGFGRTIGVLTHWAGGPLAASAEPVAVQPPLPLPVATVDSNRAEPTTPSAPNLAAASGDTTAPASGGARASGAVTATDPSAGGTGGAAPSAATPAGTSGAGTSGAGAPSSAAQTAETRVSCGSTTCPDDQVCCNPSCGICAAPGATCSQERCDLPNVQTSMLCGSNTCNVGQVCCNASCGTCAVPGASCPQALCAP